MLEIHLIGKNTEKRQNFDSSTPPGHTLHPNFTLNGETRRAPTLPPDASTQTIWEDADHKVSKQYAVLPQTTLGQISIAAWTDRPSPREKRETE
jgi:hypothetical protein